MRKIIGIGETVFDIIFENDQPTSGRPEVRSTMPLSLSDG